MKRPAFTLLETVIALAIAVVVMGAALTANRAIQNNAQIAEVRTQQEAILSDTIDLLTLTHNTLRTQVPASAQAFSTAFSGLGVNATRRIAPYRFRQTDPFAASDPAVILWCTPLNIACSGLSSKAGPTSGAFTMASALAAGGAEMIAVRKTAPVVGEPQVYDFTYLPATGTVATSLYANNAVHQQNWEFFQREISITNRSAGPTLYSGFVVTVSVWPMREGVARKGDAITRTVVFTDHALYTL